jgi:hypothetical protein
VPGALVADSFVCAPVNSGFVRLSGYTGRIVHWETSVDSGATWTIIADTANIYPYNNLQSDTRYRVLVQSGNCSSLYSNLVSIHVSQPTNAGKLYCNQTTVCQAVNSGLLELRGFAGTLIRWESSSDSGHTWNPLAGSDSSYT